MNNRKLISALVSAAMLLSAGALASCGSGSSSGESGETAAKEETAASKGSARTEDDMKTIAKQVDIAVGEYCASCEFKGLLPKQVIENGDFAASNTSEGLTIGSEAPTAPGDLLMYNYLTQQTGLNVDGIVVYVGIQDIDMPGGVPLTFIQVKDGKDSDAVYQCFNLTNIKSGSDVVWTEYKSS